MGCGLGACCSPDSEAACESHDAKAVATEDDAAHHPASEGLARESAWQRLGGEELAQPLREGLVKCVDSAYLVSLFHSGGRLERMQELPETAFIDLEGLQGLGSYTQEIYESTHTQYEWLPIVILSYSWLGRAHPDPHAETLSVLVQALEKLKPHGVVIDFASLPQLPRSTEEEERFKRGLAQLNTFYSHPHTLVFQVTEFPLGYPSARSYDLPEGQSPARYEDRGWCFAETRLSSLGKTPKFLCNLSRLPGDAGEVVGRCMNEHTPPPLSPSAFNEALSRKTFTQMKTDPERVRRLYVEAFEDRIRSAKSLLFANLSWEPLEIRSFAEVIEVNRSVQHLDLSANKAGEEGMRVIVDLVKQHPTLQSLKLTRCNLGAAGTRVLGEANLAVATLDVRRNNIGDEGVPFLAEVLRKTTALTTLNLSWNSIGAEGAGSLAKALEVNRALTTLYLTENGIGLGGARALAETLKVNTTLTSLDLRANELKVESAQVLAEAVEVNSSLRTLDLKYNWRIGMEGVRSLAEALKKNTALTALSLVNAGPEAAGFLGEALAVNATLTTLDLANTPSHAWDNSVGDGGARSLAEALKVNTALTTLDLRRNEIGLEGVRCLVEALKMNTCLTTLDIRDNRARAEDAQSLAEAANARSVLKVDG